LLTREMEAMTVSNWYCIYTKPRQEDAICHRLGTFIDIECLNPKINVNKRVRGNVSQVVEALFPRYIFLKMDINKHCHMIKNTRGVKYMLSDGRGRPISVGTNVISSIKETVQRRKASKNEAPQFTEGDRVIISNGIFDDLEAIVLKELRASDRVLVMLNTIYQARLEIDSNLLARAS